ncbi:MAG: DsrE family protein [Thaumarchaeota archaeon]|nr:DsrE family protein [Nitrososphaerota archaeon]
MTEKFAVIALTDPSDHARIFHAFLYLFDLKDSGFHSELFLDGAAVKIIDEMEKNPSDIIRPLYDRAVKESLIREACGFCANAFKVRDKILRSSIKLSQENQHIGIGQLVKEGYRILTV